MKMNDLTKQSTFIEVGHHQLSKYKQGAPGDRFLSQKDKNKGRVITVLSDGLGSGIKAGVLSTLTATMAMKFVAADIPIKRAADIIMNTLPVCKERGISYATFTIVDISASTTVRIIEYDNPPYVLVRNNEIHILEKTDTKIDRKDMSAAPKKDAVLFYSDYKAVPGDRLIFFSDGVTQSGIGTKEFPFGWNDKNVSQFIMEKIKSQPEISARDLARSVVTKASFFDGLKPKDDITCGVIYFRYPRDLLIMTGPPLNMEKDKDMGRDFKMFKGKKILCGGTTANIISRETEKPLKVDFKNLDPEIPPISSMEGADLVTEGIITLGKVSEILAKGAQPGSSGIVAESKRSNGATMIVEFLLNSDRVTFVVGTKINEAHQDPNMPEELEIRRNVIKKIGALLADQYLKEVIIRYT